MKMLWKKWCGCSTFFFSTILLFLVVIGSSIIFFFFKELTIIVKIFWQFNIYIYILKTKTKTCRSNQTDVLITSQNKKAAVLIIKNIKKYVSSPNWSGALFHWNLTKLKLSLKVLKQCILIS